MVKAILTQHAEDVEQMAEQRASFVRRPNVGVRHLSRFDTRLAANIEGVGLAGETGRALLLDRLRGDGPLALFALGVLDLESADAGRITQFIALATAAGEVAPAALDAIGWVVNARAADLRERWSSAGSSRVSTMALGACRLHGVDPGAELTRAIRHGDPQVRGAAFRTAGTIGRRDLLSTCTNSTTDDDPQCRTWAAWAALLLGDRPRALETMAHLSGDALHRDALFDLWLQAMPRETAHAALQPLARDATLVRRLIRGSGIVGDTAYVQWLIRHMSDDGLARVAGEAFSLITGADIEAAQLERESSEGVAAGPNDDPEDPNVAMDADDGLPWPDPRLVQRWWTANEGRFQKGTRYFMGAPVTREHCIDVLKSGYQRQRILAAHYLCLLEPGTPLFNTSAPAWRQQKLLAQM